MTHSFFSAAPEVYESLRAQIDAAWGYPTPYTQTCIPPADEQHKTAAGHCVIGVRVEWLGWEPVATLIPAAIAEGQINEITEAEYWATMPQAEIG